jgi:Zn-dependent peptidase ImmA (M78 family)
VRRMALIQGEKPPYSTRHILETLFPNIPVSGADLPRGVTEMAVVHGKDQRALFYSKKVSHVHQRVGLMHGLYHHLSDLKESVGIKECSLPLRKLGLVKESLRDPIEIACDLFAGEVLVPLDVLDAYAPVQLFPRDAKIKAALEDEIDTLSSRFNVPRGFMKWRLWDLEKIRRTNFFTT